MNYDKETITCHHVPLDFFIVSFLFFPFNAIHHRAIIDDAQSHFEFVNRE